MYGGKGGGSDLVTGVVPTAGGIAVLPNTGGNELLMVVSLLSIAVGVAILLSTGIRFVAKKHYKA